MSNEDGGARGSVDLTEEIYTPDYERPEHTDVHLIESRLMELLQDAVVVLLNVTLIGLWGSSSARRLPSFGTLLC